MRDKKLSWMMFLVILINDEAVCRFIRIKNFSQLQYYLQRIPENEEKAFTIMRNQEKLVIMEK